MGALSWSGLYLGGSVGRRVGLFSRGRHRPSREAGSSQKPPSPPEHATGGVWLLGWKRPRFGPPAWVWFPAGLGMLRPPPALSLRCHPHPLSSRGHRVPWGSVGAGRGAPGRGRPGGPPTPPGSSGAAPGSDPHPAGGPLTSRHAGAHHGAAGPGRCASGASGRRALMSPRARGSGAAPARRAGGWTGAGVWAPSARFPAAPAGSSPRPPPPPPPPPGDAEGRGRRSPSAPQPPAPAPRPARRAPGSRPRPGRLAPSPHREGPPAGLLGPRGKPAPLHQPGALGAAGKRLRARRPRARPWGPRAPEPPLPSLRTWGLPPV